jgi:hypothetical protein
MNVLWGWCGDDAHLGGPGRNYVIDLGQIPRPAMVGQAGEVLAYRTMNLQNDEL